MFSLFVFLNFIILFYFYYFIIKKYILLNGDFLKITRTLTGRLKNIY